MSGYDRRMEDGIAIAQLDPDAEEIYRSLNEPLGVTTFGIRQMTLAPGRGSRVHRHRRQEEVFLVLEGELTLLLDDGVEHRVPAGGLVRVAPALRRQLVNRGPTTLRVLALGGAEPHQRRDGEAFASWASNEPREPREVPLPPEGLPLDTG